MPNDYLWPEEDLYPCDHDTHAARHMFKDNYETWLQKDDEALLQIISEIVGVLNA